MKTNYHSCDSCANCSYCVTIEEYEEAPELFCHSDDSIRPPSGSILMNERHNIANNRQAYQEWAAWSKDRQVKANGICNEWNNNGWKTIHNDAESTEGEIEW